MTLLEYQAQALASSVYPLNQPPEYYALALCGEAGEVLERQYLTQNKTPDGMDLATLDELGDVLFYAVVLASKLGIKLSNALRPDVPHLSATPEVHLVLQTSALANTLKKTLRVGAAPNLPELQQRIGAILVLCDACADTAAVSDYGLDKVMALHLAKLTQRKALLGLSSIKFTQGGQPRGT